MSFFQNLFGKSSATIDDNLNIQFGRYTDAYKPQEKVDCWDKSVKYFEEKNYLNSYKEFFNYIKDDSINNVNTKLEGDTINFSITQGSKVIKGSADKEKVSVEVNVAEFEKPSASWMRKLMTLNFTLQYSRFAIKDNKVCLKFSTKTIDGSPNKLYYSLQELCIKADWIDNVLPEEFNNLHQIDVEHISDISQTEKEIKFKYLQKWIHDTLKQCEELDQEKFAGAVSYVLLALTYKIDFLIRPEGTLKNDLEKIQNIYFAKDEKSYPEKNSILIEEYRKMLEKPREYIFKNLFQSKATFGLVPPSGHNQVADFILDEEPKSDWYKDNKYPHIVKAIHEYIAGYCLFNFGMYKTSIRLFQVLVQILNQDFFTELGFKLKLIDSNGKLEKSLIEEQIDKIILKEKSRFPKLSFNKYKLKFESLPEFSKSFLMEINNLNYDKK